MEALEKFFNRRYGRYAYVYGKPRCYRKIMEIMLVGGKGTDRLIKNQSLSTSQPHIIIKVKKKKERYYGESL